MSSDKNLPSIDAGASSVALTVDEARNAILDLVMTTSETETVSVIDCVDRICAEDIFARQQIPQFRNSAMDGYAIRIDDLVSSRSLKVVGKSLAGHPFNGTMAKGTAVEITTGAMIPAEADTIVISENSTLANGQLTLTAEPIRHQHVRNPGDDIASNTKIVSRLQRLNPSDSGLIAAQGIYDVSVTKLPRVGIFSTGDELCEHGETLSDGQIYDSNRVTITSLLKRCGIQVTDLGIVKDDPSQLHQLLNAHDDYDFILSSGGVSVGQADYVKEVVGQNGELVFGK